MGIAGCSYIVTAELLETNQLRQRSALISARPSPKLLSNQDNQDSGALASNPISRGTLLILFCHDANSSSPTPASACHARGDFFRLILWRLSSPHDLQQIIRAPTLLFTTSFYQCGMLPPSKKLKCCQGSGPKVSLFSTNESFSLKKLHICTLRVLCTACWTICTNRRCKMHNVRYQPEWTVCRVHTVASWGGHS